MTEDKKLTIRKLTERECLRLMSFTDEEIDRLKNAQDERGRPLFAMTNLYKFAGNSVVVECYKHIIGEIIKADEEPVKAAPVRGQITLEGWM